METASTNRVSRSSAVMPLSQSIGLPKDHYVCRVIEETFAPSKSSGNNMITLEMEIVFPETVKDATGNTIACGGSKFKTYFQTQNSDKEKESKAHGRLFELWEKIGQKVDDFDPANPPLFFKEAIDKGSPILLDTILYGKKNMSIGGDGKPIMIGGKPVETFQTQLEGIYGISTQEINRAF